MHTPGFVLPRTPDIEMHRLQRIPPGQASSCRFFRYLKSASPEFPITLQFLYSGRYGSLLLQISKDFLYTIPSENMQVPYSNQRIYPPRASHFCLSEARNISDMPNSPIVFPAVMEKKQGRSLRFVKRNSGEYSRKNLTESPFCPTMNTPLGCIIQSVVMQRGICIQRD